MENGAEGNLCTFFIVKFRLKNKMLFTLILSGRQKQAVQRKVILVFENSFMISCTKTFTCANIRRYMP